MPILAFADTANTADTDTPQLSLLADTDNTDIVWLMRSIYVSDRLQGAHEKVVLEGFSVVINRTNTQKSAYMPIFPIPILVS